MRIVLVAYHDDVDWTSSQSVYADDMVQKVHDALSDPHVTKVELVRIDRPIGADR